MPYYFYNLAEACDEVYRCMDLSPGKILGRSSKLECCKLEAIGSHVCLTAEFVYFNIDLIIPW